MYIRFKGCYDSARVRDVRRFAIRREDCGEPDGTTTHGAELYDCSYEDAAGFMDCCIGYGCGLLADCPWQMPTAGFTEDSALAWFNSPAAAEQVLNDICAALGAGRQFFDLTRYNEDGRAMAQ